MSRDFKGVWIPREIWFHEKLKPIHKLAWAEIHSLHNRKYGGCFASNVYLGEFLDVHPKYAGEIVSHLKKSGVLELVSFNGRRRIIRAVLPKTDFTSQNDLFKETPPMAEEENLPSCLQKNLESASNKRTRYSSSSSKKKILKRSSSSSPTFDVEEEKRRMRTSLGCSEEEFNEIWRRYQEKEPGEVKNVYLWLETTLNNLRLDQQKGLSPDKQKKKDLALRERKLEENAKANFPRFKKIIDMVNSSFSDFSLELFCNALLLRELELNEFGIKSAAGSKTICLATDDPDIVDLALTSLFEKLGIEEN